MTVSLQFHEDKCNKVLISQINMFTNNYALNI